MASSDIGQVPRPCQERRVAARQFDRRDAESVSGGHPDPVGVDRPVLATQDRAAGDVRPCLERRDLVDDAIGLGTETLGRPASRGGRRIVVEELGRRLGADHPDVIAQVRELRRPKRDPPIDSFDGPLVPRAPAGAGQERGEERQARDRAKGRDQRDDQAGHRMSDEHRGRRRVDRGGDRGRIVHRAQGGVGDRQVDRGDAVTQAHQLRGQEVPAPRPVI